MALTNAEKQERYRARKRERLERAQRALHLIDAFDDIDLLLVQLQLRLNELSLCYKNIRARVPVGDKNVT